MGVSGRMPASIASAGSPSGVEPSNYMGLLILTKSNRHDDADHGEGTPIVVSAHTRDLGRNLVMFGSPINT